MIKNTLFVFAIVLTSSCIRYKGLVYLQTDIDSVQVRNHQYHINTGDNLKIEFTSTDPGTSALLNKETGLAQSSQVNTAYLYISSYSVDSIGKIEIPLLGDFQAKGLTLDQLSAKISTQLGTILKLKSVSVKMANYRISVLGEVKAPNTFSLYNDKTTILQALSMAGDLTDVGSRKKIKVVRHELGHESTKLIEIDLTSPEFMLSEGYYLFPNDVVYVAPSRVKAPRANLPIWQVGLTAVTAVLLVINILVNNNSN